MDDSSVKHFSQAFPKTTNQRNGMTLRDYFAAKAMQAYCSHSESIYWVPDEIAGDAYAMADAMLKARDAKT